MIQVPGTTFFAQISLIHVLIGDDLMAGVKAMKLFYEINPHIHYT